MPDAEAGVNMEFLESREEGKIFGDYYGLLSNDARSNDAVVHVMQVWNWKIKGCYQVSECHPTSLRCVVT